MNHGAPGWRARVRRAAAAVVAAVRAVPISVSLVVVLALVLGALTLASGGPRPDRSPPGGPGAVTDPQASVDRTALLARQALVGAVDNSRRPGPPPRATADTAVATTGGAAVIAGRVDDGSGRPLPGATVRLTRWVGDRSGSLTVTTGEDGGFTADGLLGGLWSATAWRPPDFLRSPAATAFLAADARQTFSLRTPTAEAPRLALAVLGPAADQPRPDDAPDAVAGPSSAFDVEVTVRRRQAAADGSATEQGVDGTVALAYPPGHTGPAEVAVTGGVAVVRVVCAAPAGPGALAGTLAGVGPERITVSVELPGCSPPVPATTTTVPRPRPTTSTTTPSTTTPAPEPTESSIPGRR